MSFNLLWKCYEKQKLENSAEYISDYLSNDDTCDELLQLLQSAQRQFSLHKINIGLEILIDIMHKTANELKTEHEEMVVTLAEKLLKHHFPIFSQLSSSLDESILSKLIRLLTVLCSHNVALCNDALLQFCTFLPLLQQFSASANVRKVFHKFICYLLIVSEQELFDKLASLQDVVQLFFQFLPLSDRENVIFVIRVLDQRVLQKTQLSDKSKSQFFNEICLKYLLEICQSLDSGIQEDAHLLSSLAQLVTSAHFLVFPWLRGENKQIWKEALESLLEALKHHGYPVELQKPQLAEVDLDDLNKKAIKYTKKLQRSLNRQPITSKSLLKYLKKCDILFSCHISCLDVLAVIVQALEALETLESSQTCHDMALRCLSTFVQHDDFEAIFHCNHLQLHGHVIQLLLVCQRLAPIEFNQLVPLVCLLSIYQASLALIDQKVLFLLFQMEKAGERLSQYWPLLWGNRIWTVYAIGRNDNGQWITTLPDKPIALASMLENVPADRVLASSIDLPATRKIPGDIFQTYKAPQMGFAADSLAVFDPCFLMNVISKMLASTEECPEFVLRCVDSCLLSYCVAGVASRCAHIRRTSVSCVARFVHLLELAHPQLLKWNVDSENGHEGENRTYLSPHPNTQQPPPNKRRKINPTKPAVSTSALQVYYCLSCFQQTMMQAMKHSPSQCPLSRVVVNFFVRLFSSLSKPVRIYDVLTNYLVAHPLVDHDRVPEFLRLFASTDDNFRIDLLWLVRLLAESLWEVRDFRLMERSNVFKHLLTLYSCEQSCNRTTRLWILRLLHRAVHLSPVAHHLLHQHQLHTWLRIHSHHCEDVDYRKFYEQISRKLASSLTQGSPLQSELMQLADSMI